MKKTYQIKRAITVAPNSTVIVNLQLKEAYTKCTGFFVTPYTNGVNKGTDFSALTLGLNIAQQEVLPNETDASLFALTEFISRADATYSFAEDNIPARSSDVQLSVCNSSGSEQIFNAYFILEN